jgi:hypothetical protein
MLTEIRAPPTQPSALVAVTMKAYEPLVVGVPDSKPVEDRVKPGGKKGVLVVKEYGDAPPVAVKFKL